MHRAKPRGVAGLQRGHSARELARIFYRLAVDGREQPGGGGRRPNCLPKGLQIRSPRPERRNPLYCKRLLTKWNFVYTVAPIDVTAAVITTEIPPAMMQYSIAVAPD